MEDFNVLNEVEFFEMIDKESYFKKELIQTIFVIKGSLKILQNEHEIVLKSNDIFFPEPDKVYQLVEKSDNVRLLNLALTKKILDTSIIDLSGKEYNHFFSPNRINVYNFNEQEFSSLVSYCCN